MARSGVAQLRSEMKSGFMVLEARLPSRPRHRCPCHKLRSRRPCTILQPEVPHQQNREQALSLTRYRPGEIFGLRFTAVVPTPPGHTLFPSREREACAPTRVSLGVPNPPSTRAGGTNPVPAEHKQPQHLVVGCRAEPSPLLGARSGGYCLLLAITRPGKARPPPRGIRSCCFSDQATKRPGSTAGARAGGKHATE